MSIERIENKVNELILVKKVTVPENFDKETIRKVIRKSGRCSFTPSSVYRLQVNRDFNFKAASALIPYLAELGISTIYTSPCFRAIKGSLHGYDVTDPNRFNPEIGSAEDYDKLYKALKKHKVSHIIDVVPNHMGIGDGHNLWWRDVLENGRNSMYADFFDIDWDPGKKEIKNKNVSCRRSS